MNRTRFVMVGGFLGAGKTTALAALARHYMAAGKRIGLVTNDQAENLVDTNNLREQGFPVAEVAGACFCCKFDDLLGQVESLGKESPPDVILAEPVGSCTDLVATVIKPLRDLYGDRFALAPYVVLFKPSHGLRILRGEPAGFSPKAAYIFRKQLEEADAIAVNRIDEVPPSQLAELERLLAAQFPGVPVLKLSAKTGAGLPELAAFLASDGAFGRKSLTIDYDTYAEGEAELGWLNAGFALKADAPFNLDGLLMNVLTQLRGSLVRAGLEAAHVKLIGIAGGTFGVASLVSSGTEPELALPSRATVDAAEVIVNARAAADPDFLKAETIRILEGTGISATLTQARSLRPGRPTPTHRYA